jgi:sigma-B regulation protein RsbU (phosphoserine phosphatase)
MTSTKAVEPGVTLELEPLGRPDQPPLRMTRDKPTRMGRSNECEVCLADPGVSRRHAEITFQSGTWFITDLASRHGTFLNAIKLDPHAPVPLREGDLLRVGPWTYRAVVAGTARAGRTPKLSTVDDSGSTMVRVQRVSEPELTSPAQRRLSILLDYAASINAATTEAGLVEAVLDAVMAGTGFPRSAIIRHGSTVDEVEVLGHRGLTPGQRVSVSRSLLKAAAGGEIVKLTGEGPINTAESIVRLGIQSAICAPIFLGDAIAAYLYVDSRADEVQQSQDAAAFVQAIARTCGLALANVKRSEMEAEQKRFKDDMLAAREAQRMIMPPETGTVGALRYCFHVRPGRFIAGDLFDLFPLDSRRVAIVLGDVCGKGIGSAILMCTTQSYLSAALRYHADPAKAVTDVNRHLAQRAEDNKFVSLWAGILDIETRRLTYCDAGHGYWLVARHGQAPARVESRGGGPLLRADEEHIYTADELTLAPGERVILFSDGVVEQRSPDDEEFGLDRTIGVLAGSRGPGTDVQKMFETLESFAGTDRLSDDVTIASIQVGGAGGPEGPAPLSAHDGTGSPARL